MDALRKKAAELLENGAVNVVIGYGRGSTPTRPRPVFITAPAAAGTLCAPPERGQNLATYLLKPEVRALGKAAVACVPATLRTLLQYAAENQLADGGFVALLTDGDGAVQAVSTFAALEEQAAAMTRGIAARDGEEIARLDRLPRGERWEFWRRELGRCIKCYACRAACPLCYCGRCIAETNQPQWIPVASDAYGNLEWNMVRAMHLAGRCVDCGSCAAACPEHIRIDLLNHVLAQEALGRFGAESGRSPRRAYALSSFKPDDKEDFIR